MPQTTPQMKTTTEEPKLFLAIELSEKSWKLLFSDGKYQRCATVGVGDVAGVMREAAKSREKLKLPEKCPLFSLYEAGRDGFWIHRALEKQKVSNVVADPASIEVDQRARRVKTDAVDLQKLLRHLIRYVKGEREAVRPVVVPTPAEEDARRRGRELNRLKQERTGHLCRIKSLLAVVGVRNVKLAKLTEIKTWEGKALPPILLGELQREYERLEVTNRAYPGGADGPGATARESSGGPKGAPAGAEGADADASQRHRPAVVVVLRGGILRLAKIQEPPPGRWCGGHGARTLLERQRGTRPRHHKSGQQACPDNGGADRVGLVTLPTGQRPLEVVRGTIQRDAASETSGHRRTRAQAARCALALPRTRRRP